jgi:pimeloyl-ACP methyl ester carboxylesterase
VPQSPKVPVHVFEGPSVPVSHCLPHAYAADGNQWEGDCGARARMRIMQGWHFDYLKERHWVQSIRRVVLLILLVFIVGAAVFANRNLVRAGIAEEVTIQNQGIELTGVFVRPDTPGPHPVIVMLHGAGTRQTTGNWYYRIHGNVFLRRGFAVLVYDKRGQGQSGGDPATATFADWVSDGLAAIDYLRRRADVDPDRIGLFGVSESGWYTPEIAARDGNVAFIINRVGTPLGWMEAVLWEVEVEARSRGLTELETAAVLNLKAREWQFYVDASIDPAIASGSERDRLNAELAEVHNRPGMSFFFDPELRPYDKEQYAYLAQRYAYSPAPFLLAVDVPMLYILAGRDVLMPYETTVARLDEWIEQGKPFEYDSFLEANHSLYRWESLPLEGVYASGYLARLGDWAEERIDGLR